MPQYHPGVRGLSPQGDLDLQILGLSRPAGVGEEVEEDPVEAGLDVRGQPEGRLGEPEGHAGPGRCAEHLQL